MATGAWEAGGAGGAGGASGAGGAGEAGGAGGADRLSGAASSGNGRSLIARVSTSIFCCCSARRLDCTSSRALRAATSASRLLIIFQAMPPLANPPSSTPPHTMPALTH
jgi:hypothetical protein